MIETQGVRFAYDGGKTFEFPDVKCDKGEQMLVLGQSGTGKTTFLNMLTKQLEPDGGKVVVGDTVVFGYYNHQGMPLKEGQRLLECVREVADFIYHGAEYLGLNSLRNPRCCPGEPIMLGYP